jgi:hypothetical protein
MCDSNVPSPRLAQELDRKLTCAGISASKKCRKLRKPATMVRQINKGTAQSEYPEESDRYGQTP